MKNKTKCMKIGDLVFRNNQFSAMQPNLRAKGIFVNEEYYLDIDSILKTPVSKKEAQVYGRQMNMMLPTKKQMRLIEQNLEIINNSLLSIGRGDCLLLGAVVKDFWTRYAKTADSGIERRSVLFLVQI